MERNKIAWNNHTKQGLTMFKELTMLYRNRKNRLEIYALIILYHLLNAWRRPTLPSLKTKYHWRWGLSPSSSRWDRVFTPRYGDQTITDGTR